MNEAISFFEKHQKALKVAAASYVALLLISHWQLNPRHVWLIAAVFSIVMNFTYLIEAISRGTFVKKEGLVAAVLILASVLGVLFSPLLLIAAIFGHGVWDVYKHFGGGVPFFFWYTSSCFLVDTLYSSILLIYYLRV